MQTPTVTPADAAVRAVARISALENRVAALVAAGDALALRAEEAARVVELGGPLDAALDVWAALPETGLS